MKGKDWNFEKFIPDKEDIDAGYNASFIFFKHDRENHISMNEGERIVFLFSCGFSRGCSWMYDKNKLLINGKNWFFKKFFLDTEDIDARFNTTGQFIKKLDMDRSLTMTDVDIFYCAFNRGCAWMKDKLKGEDDGIIIGKEF